MFSIIIPVHNEEMLLQDQIAALIKSTKTVVKHKPFEILLVENGSTDTTHKKAQELVKKHKGTVRVLRLKKASYGNAVRVGLLKARYPIVFRFDIEFWSGSF